jgi:hypothetical protein
MKGHLDGVGVYLNESGRFVYAGLVNGPRSGAHWERWRPAVPPASWMNAPGRLV